MTPNYHPFTGSFVRSLCPEALLLAAAVAALARGWSMIAVRVRTRSTESGSAVMQFVLLSPFLLMILLSIFQIALIMHAKFLVNYAAFCAVRSAIVVIPAAVQSSALGEAANQIDQNNPNSPKMNIIRRAAALACAGISPPWSVDLGLNTSTSPTPSGITGLAVLAMFPATAFGASMPVEYLKRAPYALASSNTSVQVTTENHPSPNANQESFQLVTVQVTYRYYLAVPFANRLFGTSFGFLRSGYYIPIREQYTLPAETDPIFPAGQGPPGGEVETEAN